MFVSFVKFVVISFAYYAMEFLSNEVVMDFSSWQFTEFLSLFCNVRLSLLILHPHWFSYSRQLYGLYPMFLHADERLTINLLFSMLRYFLTLSHER